MLFIIIAATLQTIGAIPYLYWTITGKVKPNRVTWILWTVSAAIACAAAISGGVGLAVLPVFMATLLPLLVFLASFYNKAAYWKLSLPDYACGLVSVAALLFWIFAENPTLALVLSIVANTAAAVPTWKKAWTVPTSERAFPYVVAVLSTFTALLGVDLSSFFEAAFPTCMMLNSLIISAIILLRTPRKKPLSTA